MVEMLKKGVWMCDLCTNDCIIVTISEPNRCPYEGAVKTHVWKKIG